MLMWFWRSTRRVCRELNIYKLPPHSQPGVAVTMERGRRPRSSEENRILVNCQCQLLCNQCNRQQMYLCCLMWFSFSRLNFVFQQINATPHRARIAQCSLYGQLVHQTSPPIDEYLRSPRQMRARTVPSTQGVIRGVDWMHVHRDPHLLINQKN